MYYFYAQDFTCKISYRDLSGILLCSTENSIITMISEPTSSLILNAPETGLFLDLGCGECDYTNILGSKSRKIISVDIQRPKKIHKKEITFMLSSVEHLPFNDNSFDFIYCLSVIQFIKDDRATIEEIFRTLKPGGMFYFTIPTRRSPFRIIRDLEIRFGTYNYPQFNVTHHHYYAKKDIEDLTRDLFQIEIVSGYKFNFIRRLCNLILDLFKVRRGVENIFHSIFKPKLGDETPHIRNNCTGESSDYKHQERKKNFKHFHPLSWLIYGLAYHYIIVAKKE
ncbi:class I SAM-dependent methyltransferase [Methanofollis aquaemaris]|uniref:Class I SAM-dependent methyltransferase n=1 Tax=Methanofollis aquaemaris TaxID=126734 RepID=A0A8A3S8C1_9EURY|nr:class I SAM-dependent methyltransferase [Methanofollis aquaemaris]QSZ67934.1 class I SAM-dependent methyltransferase [Methanofollis aquaemaris]